MRRFYLLFLAIAPVPAFAYLDPGTGSLLLYALAGMATTLAFGLRRLWYGIKGRVFLAGGGAVSHNLPDIVFHSEGGKYWQVFQPVIAALEREGASCAYVSPDRADPGLAHRARGYQALRPGGETATLAWMNAVRAGLVVSTTPHLDVYMLRRSRGVRRYAHLFHAPTDICYYEKYAFDWYDALLTVGPFQEASVRSLEALRGTPRKSLLPTGCTYYDYLLAGMGEGGASAPSSAGGARTALYAPAWGVRSSVESQGLAIIDSLAAAGFRVVFRPHPQFYVSHRGLIAEVEGRLAGRRDIEIDRKGTGLDAMARADLLVTDLSGILFDFACLFGRPILLAKSDADPGGQEGEDLPGPLWDQAASRELAYASIGADAGRVGDLAREALAAGKADAERLRRFREENFHNFGKAGAAAAGNILALLKEGA